MVKRKAFIFIFTTISYIAFSQNPPVICNMGFTYKVSNSENWGINEPVVVEIVPDSPAEKAGLRVNDIILEVNGKGTYLKPSATIMSWFMEDDKRMSIVVRNFESSFKPMQIAKDCRLRNAISEAQLAPVFSFYSLEDVQDRKFVMPITTKTNPDADFINYRSFDFAPSDEKSRALDERINAIFIRVLEKMGLKHDTQNPDFIIQTYYSLEKNPLYKEDTPSIGNNKEAWRYDSRNKRMIKIPVFDPAQPVNVNNVMYNLEFGYRFYDRKFIQPGASMLVWQSEIVEKLSMPYSLPDYLEMNLPLMLMKFPNSTDTNKGVFHIKYQRYNYTGISYDMNDLRTVVSVDDGSPAQHAGIKPGDMIDYIQDNSFNHNSKELTDSYRRFIVETMKYRDKNTQYTDANGFREAMFWNVADYNNVSRELNDRKRYKSGFSYLFNFNQYVDWNTPTVIEIKLDRGGEKLAFQIKPILKQNSQIVVD